MALYGALAGAAATLVVAVRREQSANVATHRRDRIDSATAAAERIAYRVTRRRWALGLPEEPEISQSLGLAAYPHVALFAKTDVRPVQQMLVAAHLPDTSRAVILAAAHHHDSLWSTLRIRGYSPLEAAEFVYLRSGVCVARDSIDPPWGRLASGMAGVPALRSNLVREMQATMRRTCGFEPERVVILDGEEWKRWTTDSAAVERQRKE